MEPMQWKSSYSVGVPALDADHKRLIDIINHIDQAAGDEFTVQWALQQLTEYARDHFQREERMLEAVGYPDLAIQINEHKQFVQWLNTLRESLPGTAPFKSTITDAVSNYLKTWLAGHILESDMKYKEYLA
jgi:hemerythrin-like metal-binding protein